VKDTSVF